MLETYFDIISIKPATTFEISHLGECLEIPENLDTKIVAKMFTKSLEWWSISPQDKGWCYCGNCPTKPQKTPDLDNDSCAGIKIAHYAALMQQGIKFPPITLIFDNFQKLNPGQTEPYFVDDGFHRISAARLAGITTVDVEIYK